jgi:hypothetical protein
MTLLTKLGQGQGYLKAGFLGFQKSGKTYTAALLAIGTRHEFGLDGPIAMFDTEGGAEYIADLILRETGKELLGVRSRSFDDLMQTAQECLDNGVSVLIVDSITHPWRELCDAYLAQINAYRKRKNLPPRNRLEFQDWAHIKGVWARWTDFYLNSKLNIIICGRAGYEYDFEEKEDSRGNVAKELVKTGIKMKTEGEFGFEPSLLVEMERVQTPTGDGGFRLGRKATVLGDRFQVLDGQERVNPNYEFFAPHVRLLKPGTHAPVDTTVRTDMGIDESGDDDFARERKTRTILAEEIIGELSARWPGQTTEEKKARQELLFKTFGTRSWTAVEGKGSQELRAGLAAIRAALKPPEANAGPPTVVYAQLIEKMASRKDVDLLDADADLIGQLPEDQQTDAAAEYHRLRGDLLRILHEGTK